MTDGTRLLLLMSPETYRASDFLAAAERVGVPVTVGTEVELAFQAQRPGAYLRLPFAAHAEALDAARRFSVDQPIGGVVAVDEEATVLAAHLATHLGWPLHRVAAAQRTRDKAEMRRVLQQAGLPGPRFQVCRGPADLDELLPGVRFPCVAKPVGLSASRGVIRADNPEELRAAVSRIYHLLEADERAGRAPGGEGILVEDFLPGRELAVEGLLVAGELQVLALFDKPDPLDGPYFEETLYITPSRHAPDEQAAVVACVASAAHALGLEEGPVHAEVRLYEDQACLLEMAARTIGGLCARTLRFGAGASLEEIVIRHALGLPLPSLERERAAAGVMMLPIPARGILREVAGQGAALRVPHVEDVVITLPLGSEALPLPEGRRYLGFLFARAETPEEVERALREGAAQLEVRIRPPD